MAREIAKTFADHITLGQAAAYERAAQAIHSEQKKYLVVEDNDPGGQDMEIANVLDGLIAEVRALGSASALELALREEWIKGFELAHELHPCGHSRGDCRDPNYKPGDEFCESQCIGCQREAKLKASLELALGC